MTPCSLCPRNCRVDRDVRTGYCGAPGTPRVARSMLHMWEEPCLSGTRGAGCIFFCGCNMNCVFCQNCAINHTQLGEAMDAEALCALMLSLEAQGAHCIDLVSPTPFVDTLLPAIAGARAAGLRIPIVYNSNGYESEETLARLAGFIDVYLPDLKYVTPSIAGRYSDCPDYCGHAARAVQAMYEQVGALQTDENGIATRGLILRHLVLPGAVGETRRVLDHIAAHFPHDIALSLMGQYVPCARAAEFPPLDRKLLPREYERAIAYCLGLGFENVWIQSLDAADASFTPAFGGHCAQKTVQVMNKL